MTESDAAQLKRYLLIGAVAVTGVVTVGFALRALKRRQLLGPLGMLIHPRVGAALMAYDATRKLRGTSEDAAIRARYAGRPDLTEIRRRQPRPLHKLYGKNPTPEQVFASKAEWSRWNSEYRRASKEYKAAVEAMNELLRRRG